jgi:putative transcriptional regulator
MDASLAGSLLVASPLLADPNFHRTVVLVLEHGEDGAVGVILNRPSGSPIRTVLPDWDSVAADPAVVFVGGPVEPEVGIALSKTGGSETAVSGIWLADLASDPTPGPARIFSGYAGWDSGQLESELGEGSWMVIGAERDDVFASDPDGLWSEVLRRQPGRLRMLSSYPPDPSYN